MVYDALVVLALIMVTLFVLTAFNGLEAVQGPWVNSLLFLEIYGFFCFFWIRRGQTVGMLAWRLKIDNRSAGPLTLAQATLRFVGGLLSFACLGLGFLWLLFDRDRRSWSDLVSSSRVLYVPPGAP